MPDDSFGSAIKADGTATVSFTPTKNQPWLLKQVSIEYRNAPSGCVAELRKNGVLITVMIASDVSDSEPPVPVAPGDRMQVNWTGGTAGDPVTVYIIYEVVDWSEI